MAADNTLDAKLARARETLAKATPGPWGREDDVNEHLVTAGRDRDDAFVYVADPMNDNDPQDEADQVMDDGAAIILAVNALPALLDALVALEEMVATQEEWERAVARVIKSDPGVFPRAIDRGRLALVRVMEVLP